VTEDQIRQRIDSVLAGYILTPHAAEGLRLELAPLVRMAYKQGAFDARRDFAAHIRAAVGTYQTEQSR
jgi:hypothetical protein